MVGETSFWLATWEEYHTGSLYLGIINGPTEGLQLVCIFYLIGYFKGELLPSFSASLKTHLGIRC
jgi:hypothetical protein